MFRVFWSLFVVCFLPYVTFTRTIVTGKLTGANGEPMIVANVMISEPPDFTLIKSVAANQDGNFEMTIDTTGIWFLQFSGVHHKSHTVTLYIDKQESVTVNVQLGAYDYLENFSDVKVTGNFNNWYSLSAVPMKKQPDSTYIADIETTTDTLVYQLMSVRRGNNMEGTQADAYTYKDQESYQSSLATTEGKAHVIFDPRKLVRSNSPHKVTFYNTDPLISKFSRFYSEFHYWRSCYLAAMTDFMRSRKNFSEFKFDWSSALASIETQIKNETDSVLIKESYLHALSIAVMQKSKDASVYSNALHRIGPLSVVWLLNPHSIYFALNSSGWTEEQQDEYVNTVITHHTSARVKSALLFDEFHVAKYSGKDEKATTYYDLLVNRLGDTPEALQIKKKFPHELDFVAGKPIPLFSVPCLDDSAKTFTNESFRGKYFLMSFWAASQHASSDDIADLSRVYKKFKNKKIEILSISVDTTKQQVMNFRKGKYKMPWKHAFVGADMDNNVVRTFQVNAIPKWLLVDSSGNLIAVDKDLHGNKLEKMLTRLLIKRK